ncbi:MAG: chorismate-binding protein [Saprospiraceae bacterium]
MDSGVAIRFIETTKNGMYFRSGGGITCFSDPIMEYQEMIDKVYLTRV